MRFSKDSILKGILLSITGFGGFAVADACAKWLSAGYPIIQINAFFGGIAALCLLAVAGKLGGLGPTLKTRKWKFHLLRSVTNVAVSVLNFIAFSQLEMTSVYTMLFMMPIFATVLAMPMFGEKTAFKGWIAILAGFCGVLIALKPWEDVSLWIFLPLCSGILISLVFLLSRHMGEQETVLSLGLYPMLGNVILTGIPTLFLFVRPDLFDALILALGGVVTAIGIIGTSQAFRMAPASKVAPFHYTQMLWAIGFGFFIFGNSPDRWTMLGAAIIIVSGIYLITHEKAAEK